MKVKIKKLAWKQLSHSAWLAILTCSFSGVFVCNLWFLLIVRVNVVSCRVTLQPVKYFFLAKIHSSIHIINSLLAANCMCIRRVNTVSTSGKNKRERCVAGKFLPETSTAVQSPSLKEALLYKSQAWKYALISNPIKQDSKRFQPVRTLHAINGS